MVTLVADQLTKSAWLIFMMNQISQRRGPSPGTQRRRALATRRRAAQSGALNCRIWDNFVRQYRAEKFQSK
jgi:hypothetical protein